MQHLVNVVNCKLKTVFILLPVFCPFPIPTHAGLSPPHKRAFSLFNREKDARGGNREEKRDKHGQTNKFCFQFTIDYIQYNAKNLKMNNVLASEPLHFRVFRVFLALPVL
jgi:hypothetical protein